MVRVKGVRDDRLPFGMTLTVIDPDMRLAEKIGEALPMDAESDDSEVGLEIADPASSEIESKRQCAGAVS